MRELFGHGRLVDLGASVLGMEFTGLRNGPARLHLQPGLDAKLRPYLGQVLTTTGRLWAEGGENVSTLLLEVLEVIPEKHQHTTPLMGVFSGNLGQKPAKPEGGFTITASLAITPADGSEDCAWLRLGADERRAIASRLLELDSGASIVITGTVNTYTYKSKRHNDEQRNGLDLTLLSLAHLPRVGRAPILSTAPEPETLTPQAPPTGNGQVNPAVSAFV